MRPGPHAKSTRQRELEGDPGRNLRRSRTDVRPSPATAHEAEPPSILGPDGRALWARLVSELDQMGLARVDLPVLEVLCSLWDRRLRLLRVLQRGSFTVARGRTRIARPEVKMLAATETLIRQYCGELGLSPSARVGLSVEIPPAPMPTALPAVPRDGTTGHVIGDPNRFFNR